MTSDLEEVEQMVIQFLKQKGGKAPLVSIAKNVNWTVDGYSFIYEVISNMQEKGILKIAKNNFGIDIVYLMRNR